MMILRMDTLVNEILLNEFVKESNFIIHVYSKVMIAAPLNL